MPPDDEEIESSTLYAADGTLVYTFHAEENRKVIPLEQIPRARARRGDRHRGRALLPPQRRRRAGDAPGRPHQRGGRRHRAGRLDDHPAVREAGDPRGRLARPSSARSRRRRWPSSSSGDYSKDRILELYLNAIYFGNGAYGIEAAAHQYFGKPATDLTLAEGALIAGLIQRPGATDPYDEPEAAVARRAARARPDARQRLDHRRRVATRPRPRPLQLASARRARPPSATRRRTSSRR